MSICISHATSTDRLPAALLKDLCPIKIGILVKSIFFIIPIKNKRWSISTYVCCAIKFVPVLRIFHSPWHFKPVSPLEHKLLVAVATGPFRLRRLTCGASPMSLTRGHTYCQGWTHIAASSSPKARSSGFTRVGVHTRCCTFCGFGQRSDVCLSPHCHTEDLSDLKIRLFIASIVCLFQNVLWLESSISFKKHIYRFSFVSFYMLFSLK